MTLKKKLTLGLGFLFLIIFVLMIFYSLYIGTLSRDAENILKDNYKSLVFSKNMISALEDMRTAISSVVFNPADNKGTSDYHLKLFEAGRIEFENNLKSENGNITEIHEREYVDTVNRDYVLYTNLCLRIVKGEGGLAEYFNEYQPAFETLRHVINKINDINMQAVERKSQMAKHDSARIINLMAGIGVFCLILAFGYFWYFPFYISNTIAYLSDRMKALLKKADIVLDIKTNDETLIILQGINLLENKLGVKDDKDALKIKGS
jgi:two-component system, NtrC family, sensor histidine kinase KinB